MNKIDSLSLYETISNMNTSNGNRDELIKLRDLLNETLQKSDENNNDEKGFFTDNGHQLMLKSLLKSNDLYVGIGESNFEDQSIKKNTQLINEPYNLPGYKRAMVKSTDWDFNDKEKISSKESIAFHNPGPQKWVSINTLFLSTGPSAESPIIAFIPLEESRTIFKGDTLIFPVKLIQEG